MSDKPELTCLKCKGHVAFKWATKYWCKQCAVDGKDLKEMQTNNIEDKAMSDKEIKPITWTYATDPNNETVWKMIPDDGGAPFISWWEDMGPHEVEALVKEAYQRGYDRMHADLEAARAERDSAINTADSVLREHGRTLHKLARVVEAAEDIIACLQTTKIEGHVSGIAVDNVLTAFYAIKKDKP